MKRRAIQLANNTLVVSLPAKWVQKNNILKGTDLDVDPKDKMLIIRKDPATTSDTKKAELDISGMSSSLVWNYLNASYRSGFSEMEIYFPQELKDIKNGKTYKTMDVISRITDKLIGMEIIRQSKSSCTIKEITQLNGDEYSNVMNRIFLSLSTIAKDILDAGEKQDKDTLENIFTYSEININKLSDYCTRILNTQGLKDFKESNSTHLIIFLLEEVGDAYADIARELAGSKKIDSKTAAIFRETNTLLELAHKFFLNPKKEYYLSFHEQRNRVKKKMDSLKDKTSTIFLLRTVLDKLMEVNNAKLTAIDGF